MKHVENTSHATGKAERKTGGTAAETGSNIEERLQEIQEQYRRVLADFDTYRNRVGRETARIEGKMKRVLLLQYLEVVDTLERAVASRTARHESVDKWIHGLYSQLLNILKTNRVEEFTTVGQPFDPEYHEAVETVTSDRMPSGTVTTEFKKGYLMDGELLRPARVQVVE